MKRLILLALLILSQTALGQFQKYDYVIIPVKFDIFYEDNAYRSSTILKHLFTGAGFKTYYDNALDDEVTSNICKAVEVDLLEEPSFLTTKVVIYFKDCKGQEVYRTQAGESKYKEFNATYQDAIQKAFVELYAVQRSSNSNDKPKVASSRDVLRAVRVDDDNFNLVDNSGRVVFTMKSTSANNVYLVENADASGLIFKEEDKWYIELNDNSGGQVKTELKLEF